MSTPITVATVATMATVAFAAVGSVGVVGPVGAGATPAPGSAAGSPAPAVTSGLPAAPREDPGAGSASRALSPVGPSTGWPRGSPGSGPPLVGEVPRGWWSWPLAPRPEVVQRFRRPRTAYGPGHRGVDLAAHPGQSVHAVAAGRVVHAGTIAGRGTVSVLHPGGVRSTYEPLAVAVRAGDVVRVGQVMGTLQTARGHCAPATCLHLGARRGGLYLDPLALLGSVPVVLLPPARGGSWS